MEAARQLEEAMEEVVKASEERENEHQVQIDDLSAQVGDGRRVKLMICQHRWATAEELMMLDCWGEHGMMGRMAEELMMMDC